MMFFQRSFMPIKFDATLFKFENLYVYTYNVIRIKNVKFLTRMHLGK